MNNNLNNFLKDDEEILVSANINQNIRLVYILSAFFTLFLIFNIEFSEIKFLLIAVDICLFIDAFRYSFLLDTTKLYITNRRVVGKKGFLKTETLDAPINKINDIMLKQNFLGKIFNCSNLIISTSSNKYNFMYIRNAWEFKDTFIEIIDNNYHDVITTADDNYKKLRELKKLLDENIISEEEFQKEKEFLLNNH